MKDTDEKGEEWVTLEKKNVRNQYPHWPLQRRRAPNRS